MARLLQFVMAMIFLLGLFVQGNCQAQCEPTAEYTISQDAAGTYKGKTKWNVTVTNDCTCTRQHVRLGCNGFQTVLELDSSILSKSDDGSCQVNYDGGVLHRSESIHFSYAWDPQFQFSVIDSSIACS